PALRWSSAATAPSPRGSAMGGAVAKPCPRRSHASPPSGTSSPPRWSPAPARGGGPGGPPLFAACGTAGGALSGRYNGKIEGPRLATRALTRTELETLRTGPVPTPLVGAVVGAWDFWRDMSSERVTDASANLLHGRAG